jgi:hypothetical protein
MLWVGDKNVDAAGDSKQAPESSSKANNTDE